MKYVSISPTDTLVSLAERVGQANLDQVLADNGLSRVPNIGQMWSNKCKEVISTAVDVANTTKVAILNGLVSCSDIYEKAALAGQNTWKTLATLNAFPNFLYVSDQIENNITDSADVIGNGEHVSPEIYNAVNASLLKTGEVDSSIFSRVSTIQDISIVAGTSSSQRTTDLFSWFKLPVNEVMLYSSIDGETFSIPAYPETVSDKRNANYTTMPDLIYQYEPWQMYESSGPRMNSYSFHLHRDMWTGDHGDGNANKLIRFCQAQCYPQYNGASVNIPTVTLYIAGKPEITGVMNDVGVEWSGPLGMRDNWYLEFNLTLTITEVSSQPLNYDVVKQLSLVG